MKNIAVILSGCGFKDGAEITESVSSLIALGQNGANYKVFAPKLDFQPIDHISGETQATRNLMQESARITRGQISDLSSLNAKDYDAVVFPGGFGVALHLCDWAEKGSGCYVHPEAQRIIKEFYEQSKPIGGICIAPALIAKVLGSEGVELTIGNDKDTAAEIEKTGAAHIDCRVDDYVTDRAHKVITTPAYMYEAQPHEVFKGIQGAIKELVEMA